MSQRSVVVELRPGDQVKIGDATVVLREKSGQRARLVVLAPASVNVEPPQRSKPLQPQAAAAN